jgi:hypothetical protein
MTSISSIIHFKDRPTTEFWFSGFYLLMALLVIFIMAPAVGGSDSTFVLSSLRGGVDIPAPDLVLPSTPTLYVLGLLLAIIGIWQLVRGFSAAR